MKTVVLSIALLLAGCAAPGNDYVWQRSGSTRQEFDMDAGQCRTQAFSPVGAPLFQRVMIMDSCMEGKGWVKAPRT